MSPSDDEIDAWVMRIELTPYCRDGNLWYSAEIPMDSPWGVLSEDRDHMVTQVDTQIMWSQYKSVTPAEQLVTHLERLARFSIVERLLQVGDRG